MSVKEAHELTDKIGEELNSCPAGHRTNIHI